MATKETFNFSEALARVLAGFRVARTGWNGKGMCIFIHHGSSAQDPKDRPELIEGIPSELFQYGHAGTATVLPSIHMQTASGSVVPGWLASQADLLASDWVTVE